MAINEQTLERRFEQLTMPAPDADIRDRVRYLITRLRKTQARFAEMIGIDSPNLSRLLKGHTPFTDAMVNRIVVNLGVSKEWLLNGTDVPFAKNVPVHPEVIAEAEASTQTLSPMPNGAPVYDIDATAGFGQLSEMFTDDRIVGYLNMPQINPGNIVTRVSGDSMIPQIPNGAYIAIRPIASDAPIFWGQTYLVVLEDYRMVKILRRHADPNKVILHSNNPDFDDMEIDRSAIHHLYVVDAVINCELLA